MPHRPADSRLLVNLISHEKEYSKHLQALFDPSHLSLSAFTAYASASAPPLSHTIIAVATSLAAADDALARYAAAVDQYRDHLKHIKSLEDDVANVFRDREILVTRLIKASKSHKPTKSLSSSNLDQNRNSLHLNLPHPSSSSSSLTSTFSSPAQSLAFSAPLPTSAKLSAAQAELQACEAHLANKERQLAVGRTIALKEGLALRLKALIECAWVWGEAGKEALTALDGLTDTGNDFAMDKPLPLLTSAGNHAPDDISSASASLAPSQSESQHSHTHAHAQMYIPPAHAISDSQPFHSRHVLTRRITEEELTHFAPEQDAQPNPTLDQEDEEGGSSVDESLARPLVGEQMKVVENPRFVTPSKKKPKQEPVTLFTGDPGFQTASPPSSPSKQSVFKRFSIRHPSASSPSIGHTGAPSGSPSQGHVRTQGSVSSVGSGSGFFGSIRGLFSRSDAAAHPGRASSLNSSPGRAVYEAPVIEGLPASSSSFDNSAGNGKLKSKGKWSGKKAGKWEMDRTERNLKSLKGGTNGDSDDDEGEVLSASPSPTPRRMIGLRGRTRVVSDVGIGAAASSRIGAGAEPSASASTSNPPPPESQPTQAQSRIQGQQSPSGTGRKLKKAKARSASVPPGMGTGVSVSTLAGKQAAGPDAVPEGTGKPKRSSSLARKQSKKAEEQEKEKKNDQSATTSTEGVKQGYTVTVVGSSSPSFASSTSAGALIHPVSTNTTGNATLSESVSAPVSRRPSLSTSTSTSTSTKTGSKAHAQRNVLEPGKGMMSLLSVVADGDRVIGNGGNVGEIGGTREKYQGKERESFMKGEVGMKATKAPGSVLVGAPGDRVDANPEAPTRRDQDEKERGRAKEKGKEKEKGQEASPKLSPSPTKSPLKSALKNPSRTPSPMPPLPPSLVPPNSGSALGHESGACADHADVGAVGSGEGDDDAASMSSYETGHEAFFYPDQDGSVDPKEDKGLTTKTGITTPTGPPVPEKRPPLTNGSAVPRETKQESPQTVQGTAQLREEKDKEYPDHQPKRRKSVRVSLQPTFSPTPPAIEYEESTDVWNTSTSRSETVARTNEAWWNDNAKAANSAGKPIKGKARKGAKSGARKEAEERDVWEDSSEEDMEYTRARKLLIQLT